MIMQQLVKMVCYANVENTEHGKAASQHKGWQEVKLMFL